MRRSVSLKLDQIYPADFVTAAYSILTKRYEACAGNGPYFSVICRHCGEDFRRNQFTWGFRHMTRKHDRLPVLSN